MDETPEQTGDDRGITSPEGRPDQATRPPGNPEADERAVREGEDKLEQAGGGH